MQAQWLSSLEPLCEGAFCTDLPVSESEAGECGAHWNEACPGPTLDPLHDERQVVNGGLADNSARVSASE